MKKNHAHVERRKEAKTENSLRQFVPFFFRFIIMETYRLTFLAWSRTMSATVLRTSASFGPRHVIVTDPVYTAHKELCMSE